MESMGGLSYFMGPAHVIVEAEKCPQSAICELETVPRPEKTGCPSSSSEAGKGGQFSPLPFAPFRPSVDWMPLPHGGGQPLAATAQNADLITSPRRRPGCLMWVRCAQGAQRTDHHTLLSHHVSPRPRRAPFPTDRCLNQRCSLKAPRQDPPVQPLEGDSALLVLGCDVFSISPISRARDVFEKDFFEC